MIARVLASVLFLGAVAAGTFIEEPLRGRPSGPTVLAGDLHVHAFPADGALPVWEIQREASRRGIDVVAITNHNRNFAIPLANASGLVRDFPIVIPAQELTTARFHIAAVGISSVIDWRLSARDAIAEIHRQGGVAIAAHPLAWSWREQDPGVLRLLDGVEVAHPVILFEPGAAPELLEFFGRAKRANSRVAPIGSSDFHGGAPLGVCRTYLVVDEVSQDGVLDAIRRGRSVASGPGDRLVGDPEHVQAVRAHLRQWQGPGWGYGRPAVFALLALASLAVLVVLDGGA